MLNLFFAILLTPSVVVSLPESGSLLTYRGHILAEKGDPEETRKTFQLIFFLADINDSGVSLYWTLSEKKRGAWPWPDHFGHWNLDSKWQGNSQSSPSLLYDRGDGFSEVPIISPFLQGNRKLSASQIWTEGRLNYRVMQSARTAGRDSWQVDVRSPIGKKRTLWVDQSSSLIVGMSETVFMGTGIKHRLQLDLVESKKLSPENAERMEKAFAAMLKLRQKLGRKTRSRLADWNEAQLSLLTKELPAISKLTRESPLAEIISKANADLRFQQSRSGAISRLKNKYLGRKVPRFKLSGTSGEKLSEEKFPGKVTVLHFWQYRDKPLLEPYGQVGYLDYLYRRHKKDDLKVIGIHVNGRLSEESSRAKAVRGVKKLKSFMNLSYPVFLDNGEFITQLGDPRKWGADLPLYVVIGPDGKVIHYHTGFYEVHRDRGLEKLDKVVTKALKTAG